MNCHDSASHTTKWVFMLAGALIAVPVSAGITTDGSVGAVTTLSGTMTIPQSLGTTAGSNLFHSFSTFNIVPGESATFTTSTALSNVISRVTGGSPSAISGLLKLDASVGGGTPAFWFINPAGVTFGAGASIDMPGAFHVGTADYVKFPDGNFYADLSKTSTFSTAPPKAFGFLGTTRSNIDVSGDTIIWTQPQQPISIIAGDVTVDSAGIWSQGGDIRILALGPGPQEVALSGALPQAYGNLNMLNLGQIDASGWGTCAAGNILVSAGNININYAFINNSANGGISGDGGRLDIAAAGTLLMANGAYIFSDTYSSDNSSAINVTAKNIRIDGQGRLTGIESAATGISATGNLGPVTVTATDTLSLFNGGMISSVNGYSPGNGGVVRVLADMINIDGQGTGIFTGIASQAYSSGISGDVSVAATGTLSLTNGGLIAGGTISSAKSADITIQAGTLTLSGGQGSTGIYSQAERGSTGNAGSINVTADTITIDGQGILTSSIQTLISSNALPTSSGTAGTVTVSAHGNLQILNNGAISSSTFSSGAAESVNVTAGKITIDGGGHSGFTGIGSNADVGSSNDAGFVTVSSTGNLSIIDGGEIATITKSSGNAGMISVSADTLTIDGQDSNLLFTGIVSDAEPGSSGNAGTVDVSVTGELYLINVGQISSSTFSSGRGGSVTVQAGALSLNKSLILATAFSGSSGQTGNVTVTANDITLSKSGQISIQNDATVADPSLQTPTSITVTAPRIALQDASISAASTGNVAASNIVINFGNLLHLDPSSITTSASLGNGGDITINGGNGLLWLDNSQITTSVLGGTGNGGDISISAGAMFMNTGFIQANTAAAGAAGGLININVPTILASGSSLLVGGSTPYTFQPGVFGYNVIQAAAPDGVSGNINMTGPVLDVSGSLAAISATPLESGGLSRSVCETTEGSSLSFRGWDTLPASASDPL